MATKAASTGSKRKATVGSKGKSDGKSKKARLETVAQTQRDEDESSDDFDSFSDSDDGGVKLDDEQPKKQYKKADGENGKTGDKGKSRLVLQNMCISGCC